MRKPAPKITKSTLVSTPRSRRPKPAVRGANAAPAPNALTVSRTELTSGDDDRDFRRLVQALFAFFANHQAIRDGHAKQIGLSGIEYLVLSSIRHFQNPEGVFVGNIADELGFSGAFVSLIISKLDRLGLVTKKPDPDDRRKRRLQLTAKASAELDRLSLNQRRINDVQFDCLSGDQFQTLLRTMEALVESSKRARQMQSYLSKSIPPAKPKMGRNRK